MREYIEDMYESAPLAPPAPPSILAVMRARREAAAKTELHMTTPSAQLATVLPPTPAVVPAAAPTPPAIADNQSDDIAMVGHPPSDKTATAAVVLPRSVAEFHALYGAYPREFPFIDHHLGRAGLLPELHDGLRQWWCPVCGRWAAYHWTQPDVWLQPGEHINSTMRRFCFEHRHLQKSFTKNGE